MLKWVFLFNSATVFSLAIAQTKGQENAAVFRNQDIAQARFGNKTFQKLARNVSDLEQKINKRIIGQEPAARALSVKVSQYIDSFGSRKGKPPIAQHFIGFPGVGKSGIAEILAEYLPVVRIDAQRYLDPLSTFELGWFLKRQHELHSKTPVILLIEEVDKVREIVPGEPERTSPFIGAFNQLLNDGKISIGETIDLSHVMVVTTMNLPPEIIEEFSDKVLERKKGFYEYGIEDFSKFYDWLTKTKGAVSRVLSKLFRTNTVGRLAPNVLILRHLSESDYKNIIRLTIDSVVESQTTGINIKRKLQVSYSDNLVDFFFTNTVNPSLGARETVVKVSDMIEQLISYGMRAQLGERHSLDRPRKLNFDSPNTQIELTITTQKRHRDQLSDQATHKIDIEYDPVTASFLRPPQVTYEPPQSANREKSLTKGDVIRARFPKKQKSATGLARAISSQVYGQEDFAKYLEEEMNKYLASGIASLREPKASILAGFSGIGKSAMIEAIGEALNIPVARVNLQGFSSSSDDATIKFIDTLQKEIERARSKPGYEGKFIVLLEEIDKIGEIDPFGGPKDRPIITVVKDIIDRGRASATTKEQMSIVEHIVQVSDAYIFATMNFDGKIFDFKADPRLTTARDMIKAWEHIEANKASLKEVLEKMFRPDTISRFLPITHVIRPLEAQHYFQVINAQIEKIIRERFSDSEGKDNGKIEIRLSESYQNYLFRETVIPSEGARYTVDISRRLLNRDLENALTHLPRYLRSVPLSIQFQFLSDSSTVFATVQPRDKSHPETEVFRTPVQLMFPDPRIFGKLPADRVLNAAHEFGHAYTAVRLGLRIEVVSSVSPMSGVGGYVKYSGNNSEAMAFIARVYANLGSRALERIVLSAKPLQKRSVMDITSGSTSDIEKATETLYTALFKLGFDPNGGTVDAQGGKPDRHDKYVDFAELPYKTVERLGEILREMEDFLVQDLLNANDIEWYKDKILKLARTGIVDETELYQLLEYKAPGREGNSPGLLSRVYEVFGNEILDIDTDETRAARVFRQGSEMRTARDNLKVYVNVFERILENSLHQNNAQRMPTDSCPKWLSTLK